jgi:CubicO group peptidase (beta-lactamase class C family)
VKPESVGFSTERLHRIDAAIQADLDAHRKVGAVVLVARHGKIAYLKAYGMADAEHGRPMKTDDIFRIMSLTKPYVSVGLLMLYEEGKFSLTDPVEKFIPSFAKVQVFDHMEGDKLVLRAPHRKMTILDVMRHTSGFPRATELYKGPVEAEWRKSKVWEKPLTDYVEALPTLPMLYDPGDDWRYGPEHDIQAVLIEKISGMKLADYLRTRIFEPLGMKDTAYEVPAGKMARVTVMYGPDGAGGVKAVDRPETSEYLAEAKQPYGGSGITTTPLDQLKFGQMLLNGGELNGVRLLSRKTVAMMTSNQLPPQVKFMSLGPATPDTYGPTNNLSGLGYGLGVGVTVDPVAAGRPVSKGTYSWAGSGTTDMYVDPTEDMITLAFTQWPGDFPWMYKVQTLTYQALVDQPPKD